MFPTHLLYEAWRNTSKVLYNTSDGSGNSIVRELEFSDPVDNAQECSCSCFLCGDYVKHGLPRKKVISDKFTDWSYARSISSAYVCLACSFVILTSKGNYGVRTFSTVSTPKELHVVNRVELRNALLDPPEPPFLILLAVSQKKHLAYKGSVNFSRDIFSIMYEETPVLIVRSEFTDLLELVEMYLHGFTKTEISTGNFNQQRVLKFGLEIWEWFEEKIKPHRGTALLDTIMFVAQKVEEEERFKCFLDSIRKTTTPPLPLFSSTSFTAAETNDAGHRELTCGDKSKDSQRFLPNEQLMLDLF